MSGTARQENLARKISEDLADHADIIAVYSSKKEILVKGSPKESKGSLEPVIKSRLSRYGRPVEFLSNGPFFLIRLRDPSATRMKAPWSNIVLFLGTGLTTILTGALWQGVDWLSSPLYVFRNPLEVIRGGLPFSLSLLAILVFHEFGHYFAARYHRVDVSLPYFIPAPPGIFPFGTFGALIKSKSAFMNRKQLLDVGAAGPISGLIISIIVLFIGISGSVVQPMSGEIQGLFFGESLLFKFMTFIIKGPVGGDNVLIINSIGLAGWVGLLVTMFNLMPMGQLDGGHIVYALFGKAQKFVAIATIGGLAVLSFYWPGWILWIIIGLLLKPAHSPTVMDDVPLGTGRRIVGIISIVSFIICFIPAPISLNF